MKFSAVTITRNEQERIARCLKTLSWCDEIIVVDDDSSDKTREIARKFTTRVIQKTKDTEATQWRYALSLAKGDWIIWLGADQWLSKTLIKDIKQRVGKEEYNGYMVTMQEFFLGRPLKIKETPDYRAMWVVKRKQMIMPKVRVHQYLKVKGKIGVLKGVMFHETFRSFDQIFNKFNYYTTLQAQEAYLKGVRTSLLKIMLSPVYTVLWRQIKLKEYRDGVLGILLSICFGVDKLSYHLKIWELQFRERREPR